MTSAEVTISPHAGDPIGLVQPVHGRPFLTLLRYNLRYKRRYLAGAVLSVIFVTVTLTTPLIVRAVTRDFNESTMTWPRLLTYFCLLLGSAVVSGIARYFQRTLMIGASRLFEYDLRNHFFRHIQSLSQSFFHRVPTGDLMARATNDVNYIREFVGPGVMGTVDMIRIPFTLGVMVWFSPRLTLIALVPLPFISILVYVFMRYMNRQSKIVQEIYSGISERVQENLAGARVVKAYGIAARETREFLTASNAYMRANIKLVAIMSCAIPLIGILVGVIILLVIWQGGRMVILNQLPLADLSGFIVAMIMLAWPLAQFGWTVTLYQRGAVSMDRLSGILTEVAEIRDDNRTDHALPLEVAGITFDHVSFTYGGGEVLRDITLEIPPGSSVAVVGPTGAGKTTLISLITREYDPSNGAVMLAGHDVLDYSLKRLRQSIGYVPQDTFIFSDTIRNNIALGVPGADDEQIMRACRVAQLADTLAQMPQGLDTLLGERGINLSGGQKQRLTLARAIVRDPKLLILDDALSSVDTQTEERILTGLREVLANRTSIIVSHRVSTIRHADTIFVLDAGRIAEQGSHDALLAQEGIYAAMYQRQLLEQALEDEV